MSRNRILTVSKSQFSGLLYILVETKPLDIDTLKSIKRRLGIKIIISI